MVCVQSAFKYSIKNYVDLVKEHLGLFSEERIIYYVCASLSLSSMQSRIPILMKVFCDTQFLLSKKTNRFVLYSSTHYIKIILPTQHSTPLNANQNTDLQKTIFSIMMHSTYCTCSRQSYFIVVLYTYRIAGKFVKNKLQVKLTTGYMNGMLEFLCLYFVRTEQKITDQYINIH